MKLKNLLLTGLSFVLVATVAIGGTLAYLTSEDSDVNVMTLGNVKIAQHEYQRVENDGAYETKEIDGVTSYVLEDFKQGKDLLPIVGDPSKSGTDYAGWDNTVVRMTQVNSYGSMQVFAGKNAQDKFVTVENTGKSDAYIRTLVAIEIGSTDGSLIGTSFHQTWKSNNVGAITVDGNNYMLVEYEYIGGQLSDGSWRHENGILPAGDTSYPNLAQVYLKSEATNEDMVAIDGNGNGTLDILVLSQAVQTNGFADAKTALDTAFGTSAEKAAEWFGGTVIPVYARGAEALDYVLDNGGKLFVENNISTDQITVDEDTTVEINLQDNTLSGIVINNGEMNVSDGKMEGTYIQNNGDATFTNVDMVAGDAANYGGISKGKDTETVYDNVNIISGGGGIGATGGAQVIFNSGSVYVDSASTSARYVIYTTGEGSSITINGGTFSWDKNDNQKRAYVYADAGTTVTINGGTFGPASTRSGYTAGILGQGTIIIKGGTFGFNPSAWVADGYEAVEDGSTWTVVAQ